MKQWFLLFVLAAQVPVMGKTPPDIRVGVRHGSEEPDFLPTAADDPELAPLRAAQQAARARLRLSRRGFGEPLLECAVDAHRAERGWSCETDVPGRASTGH